MKNILILLTFIITLFANNNDFLKPSEAFKINIFEKQNSINIDINLDKTIYVYDNRLKVYLNKKDITKKVFSKQPIKYHEFLVHFNQFNIIIPKKFIKENTPKNSIYTIKFEYQGCSKKGLCYAPMDISYSGSLSSSNTITNKKPKDEVSNIKDILSSGNIFIILISFFGFGLFLSLTPCIFPMIPILSSIIVQHSNNNKGKMSASKGFFLSLVYVLSMSVAYTIAGILAGLFGANIQAMLQNTYVLIAFSAIFVALAFSLFGYYSLELPQSFTNKINNITGGDKNKGLTSVAIMGFLSALIVGPCVAPPLAGALVYIGQTGDAILGGLALFVMSLGLGMPLLIVGAGAGKYMPKPGGWMEMVSKVFGVVMLALAIYMLNRLISDQITFILYGILSFGTSIYLIKNSALFGKIIAILLIMVGSYFIYLSTNIKKEHIKFRYITSTTQLDNILKNSKKPVMLDFWASWCVSCKELEHITYANKKVQNILSKYQVLKVDVTNNTPQDKELMKRFNIFGPPALIFWDKKGNEIKSKRMIGYKNPKEFIKIMSNQYK